MDELGNHSVPRGNHRGATDRLREMLAQAVRDHAADQRSNAGVVEDIRQRVEEMAAAIAGLAEKVCALDARLERLDERHDDQYDRLTSLEETLLLLAEALLCPGAREGAVSSGAWGLPGATGLSCAVCRRFTWTGPTPRSWTRRTRSAATATGSRSMIRRWST
jgi:hypothetical protein